MDAVLRAASIYVFLVVVFRISGKRTLTEITTFDFVLLLIIGEATQQGLIGDDFSVTKVFLLVITLVSLDLGMSLLQQRSRRIAKLVEGCALIVLEDGRPLRERMQRVRLEDDDILEAARELQGLERLDQIKYAVLERSGHITIVPQTGSR